VSVVRRKFEISLYLWKHQATAFVKEKLPGVAEPVQRSAVQLETVSAGSPPWAVLRELADHLEAQSIPRRSL